MIVNLNKGFQAVVDEIDLPLVMPFRWHVLERPSKFSTRHYAKASGNVLMHRLIAAAPLGAEVDHINGNGLDNRRANLRVCTRAQNAASRRSRGNYEGLRGVCASGSRWQVCMVINGENHTFGSFEDQQTAGRVADAIAKAQWGEFARLNFPERSGPLFPPPERS